jgi:hypothetical protein
MKTKLIILTLSLLASVFVEAKDGKDPTIIKGTITDQVSGKVIQGAVITIEKNGQLIQSVQSNESGGFTIRYEGNVSQLDVLKVKIYKPGYLSKRVKTLSKIENEVKVELEKKPKFQPFLFPNQAHANFDI